MTPEEAELYYRKQCYRAAQLIRAGVHPDLLARLTPRQVHDLYAHPADADTGKLTPPDDGKPATLAQDLATAEAALATFGASREQKEAVYQAIRRRHENAGTRGGGGDRAGDRDHRQGG